MSRELLPYYERELLFIRKMASEFAERYPERAEALRLTSDGCDDPHVERMIEAFALIAGRIQHKIDEEFPEITQALLDVLYPHFLRPVPAMAIAQLEIDAEQSRSPTGYVVPRGVIAYTEPISGIQCRFRSAFPVRLFPFRVASAAFSWAANLPGGVSSPRARYAIRIDLQTQGVAKFSGLQLHHLRFYIGGDPQAAHWIYELLFNNVTGILLRCQNRGGEWVSRSLVPNSIAEVGFGRDEAVLPYADTSFQGYRLLQEYFSFPQKFLFFDLTGLDGTAGEPFSDHLQIVIMLDEFQRPERSNLLESAVGADTFQLGCTPMVNLFDVCSEPIRLSHAKTEYRIVPDLSAPQGTEVYSVNRVTSASAYSKEPKEYRPFYSLRHDDEAREEAYWYATRHSSERDGDPGTDVYLSFVDRNFKPSLPAKEAITAEVTCTNRNLPEHLPLKGRWGELDLESSAIVRTRILTGPSKVLRPPQRKGLQWRLISHLSLNHLSLVDGGADALREILRLYDTDSSHSSAMQIAGLTGLHSTRKVARIDSEHGFVLCQGTAIETEFDEEHFVGGGAFLLACILERFFGLYSAVNSFTQLRVTTRQRKGIVWAWPPRTGEQIVV